MSFKLLDHNPFISRGYANKLRISDVTLATNKRKQILKVIWEELRRKGPTSYNVTPQLHYGWHNDFERGGVYKFVSKASKNFFDPHIWLTWGT